MMPQLSYIKELKLRISQLNVEIDETRNLMSTFVPKITSNREDWEKLYKQLSESEEYQELSKRRYDLIVSRRHLQLKLNQLRQKYWCWD